MRTKAETKKLIKGLIHAAAAGQEDAQWLDNAIKAVGYVKKGERLSKGEQIRREKLLCDRLAEKIESIAKVMGERIEPSAREQFIKEMESYVSAIR